jgi:hypothetical protein
MNKSRDNHVKGNKPGSEGQRSYVFPHMWNLDLKYMYVYVYVHMHIYMWIYIHVNTHTYE